MEPKIYDVIIIGAGPAGLTAAIYCVRAGRSVIVLEKETIGGKITESPLVYNIPGFPETSGQEFGDLLAEQATSQGVEITIDEVMSIELNKEDDNLTVVGSFDTYVGRTCIIATGTKNRGLNLHNEDKLIGNGISFCATCDGPFYRGKDVAVIGGGNSAVTYALELSQYANKVTVIQNLPSLTAEKALCDALKTKKNVEIIYGSVVTDYITSEDGAFKGLRIFRIINGMGDSRNIIVDGVFLAIGLVPDNGRFRNTGCIALDDRGFIKGTMPPIFACGDCISSTKKQVVIAAASGAETAMSVLRYLD